MNTQSESHCAVKLNRTHTLLAGGFARAYRFNDPISSSRQKKPLSAEELGISELRPRRYRRQTSDIGGGVQLNRAWIYDGYDWNEVEDMSQVRDRPACSLLPMSDGTVRVLVAGGCEGWCYDNPGTKTAEMYNPETDKW